MDAPKRIQRKKLLDMKDSRLAEIEDATVSAIGRYREGYLNRLALEVTLMGIGWPDHLLRQILERVEPGELTNAD